MTYSYVLYTSQDLQYVYIVSIKYYKFDVYSYISVF